MDEKWQELYNDLFQDLWSLTRAGGADPSPGQTESCFKCCLRYWETCKAMVREIGFDDDAAEIRFFRLFKPRFTGQLEYYSLVYQYQLFLPPGDAREQVTFRVRERGKIDRFHLTHAAFIAYYNSGQKYNDPQYFLQRHFDPDQPGYVRPFDRDPAFRTTADWILTVLTGDDLYEKFLAGEEGGASPRASIW